MTVKLLTILQSTTQSGGGRTIGDLCKVLCRRHYSGKKVQSYMLDSKWWRGQPCQLVVTSLARFVAAGYAS